MPETSHLRRMLVSAGAGYVLGAVTAGMTTLCAAESEVAVPPIYSALRSGAADEIRAVEEDIDRIERAALVLAGNGGLDPFEKITTLGKLLLFDKNLSVKRNEACVSATCRKPDGPGLFRH